MTWHRMSALDDYIEVFQKSKLNQKKQLYHRNFWKTQCVFLLKII